MMRRASAVMTALLLSGPALAQSFQDGVAAYVAGDTPGALEIWIPLAETGHRDAQFNVGILAAQGLGVPKDQATALEWLRRAADQGDTIAAYNMGLMLSSPEEGAPNYSRAAAWYEQAAADEHPGAMENLALMLANGQGVAQDLRRAVKLATVSEELECLVGDMSGNFKPRMTLLGM